MSEEKRSTAGGAQPISRHPLFPAIVALWAGALFGLASLALRPALVERMVLAFGIDKVIPMATPPLGTTTRILIALTMTGMGALLGALMARRIAPPAAPVESRRRRAEASHDRQPMEMAAATDEKRPAGRQRRLGLSSGAGAADGVEVQARQAPSILNVAEFALDHLEESSPVAAGRSPEPGFDFLPEAQLDSACGDAATVTQEAASHAPSPSSYTSAHETVTRPAATTGLGSSAAERIASADLDDLSPLELLERLALAMARARAAMNTVKAAPSTVAAEPEEPTPVIGAAEAETAPPETAPPETAPAVEAQVVVVEQADAPASLQRLPAALRPVALEIPADEVDEDDDSLPGYIPPRHIGLKPAAAAAEEGINEDQGSALAHGYSSLLDLSRSHPDRTAGIERPFDAPGNSDPESAEKALRDALATLQRMSGAA